MESSERPRPDEIISVNGVNFKHDDFFRVVDDFYTRIQSDPILQVPFRSVHDWPEHIERLTHFWWMKFGGKPYLFGHYNPVPKHYFAGFNRELLGHWLSLFHSTLKDHLTPAQSTLWILISSRMGEGLAARNDLFAAEYETQKKP